LTPLTRDTLVPVGAAAAVMAGMASAAWYVGQEIQKTRYEFAAIRTENRTAVNEINESISQLTSHLQRIEGDAITIPYAAELALRFAVRNPGIKVPDPRNPTIALKVDLP
jgi:hypothetical protein